MTRPSLDRTIAPAAAMEKLARDSRVVGATSTGRGTMPAPRKRRSPGVHTPGPRSRSGGGGVVEPEAVLHPDRDAGGVAERALGRAHREASLEGNPAVRLHRIGRALDRRLHQVDRRLDRVADVPDAVPVEIRLAGVRDRRAVVVVVADFVAIHVAATRRRAHTLLTGVGQRADERLAV